MGFQRRLVNKPPARIVYITIVRHEQAAIVQAQTRQGIFRFDVCLRQDLDGSC